MCLTVPISRFLFPRFMPLQQTRSSYFLLLPPEPYVEQDSIALAAETGNGKALDIILSHFGSTGSY